MPSPRTVLTRPVATAPASLGRGPPAASWAQARTFAGACTDVWGLAETASLVDPTISGLVPAGEGAASEVHGEERSARNEPRSDRSAGNTRNGVTRSFYTVIEKGPWRVELE